MAIAELFLGLHNYRSRVNTSTALGTSFAESSYEELEAIALLFPLNFDETGDQIRSILEKRYTDGISGFEGVKVEGDKIVGLFYDIVSPSLTKKFNFSINGDTGDVDYTQIDTGNLDTNFSEYSFATKGKSKQCKEGKSSACTRGDGSVYCIKVGYKCRSVGLSDEERAIANAIAEKGRSESSAKTKTPKEPVTAKAEEKEQLPPVRLEQDEQKISNAQEGKIDINSLPQGKQTEYAREWGKHWDDAPEDLKAVLKVIDQPNKILDGAETGTAFYRQGGIFMHVYSPDGDKRDGSVWRHEYGHHLDEQITQYLGNDSFEKLLASKGTDLKTFENDFESDDPNVFRKSKKIQSEIAKELGLSEDAFLEDILKSANGSKSSFISSSKKGKNAFKSDEELLLKMHKDSNSLALKEYEENINKYKNKGLVPAMLEKVKSEEDKAEVGRHIRKLRISEEINTEAEKRAISSLKLGKRGRLSMFNPSHKKELEKQKNQVLNEKIESQIPKDSLAYRMFKESGDNLMAAAVLSDHESPVTLAKLTESLLKKRGKNSAGLAEDLIGSITFNKVGQGHSDEYYSKSSDNQNTEAMANLISIHGTGDKLAIEAIQKLSPNGYKFVKETLQEVVNAARRRK